MEKQEVSSMEFHFASNSTLSTRPQLDLNLSIGTDDEPENVMDRTESNQIEALRWRAAEQIRLAAVDKAYAEQVRELTRREMEMAEEEFRRARLVLERAREDVEKVEKMKEMLTVKVVGSTCAEITCRHCRTRFPTLDL